MATALLTPRRTLIDTILPRSGAAVQAAVIVAASILVALCAQLTIPLPVVPITGQTYAFLLVGAVLGSRRGCLAMLAYLVEGLAGLPVFAAAHSAWTPSVVPGLPTILGPTAGYLFACPFVALVVGALAERGWDRRLWTAVAAMAAGEIAIYAGGLAWLSRFVGWPTAVQVGLVPFIAGDTAKLLLAAATLPAAWWALQRVDTRGRNAT